MTKPRAQQKEIARLLNISPTAVSMALRGTGRISTEVRERVIAASLKYGIEPRASVTPRHPGRGRLRIGLVGPGSPMGWFNDGVLTGMAAGAGDADYDAILLPSIQPQASDLGFVDRLLANRLDAVVACGSIAHVLPGLRSARVPLIHLGYYPEAQDICDTIAIDNGEAGYRLTMALLDAGCRRVATVRCMPEQMNSQEKHSGFLRAMAERGLQPVAGGIMLGDCLFEAGLRCARMVAQLEEQPDAIFVENDWITHDMLQALSAMGWPAAKTVRIAHCRDSQRESAATPGVLSADVPLFDMGYMGIRLLLDRMIGHAPPHHLLMRMSPAVSQPGT